MRLIPGWKHILLFAAPIALGAGVLAGALASAAPPSSAAVAAMQPTPGNAARDVPPVPGLLVHVTGAVAKPGLYRLGRGDRVYDAIAAAGGLRSDADPKRLPNLAGRLRDGEQIKVAFVAHSSSGTVTSRTNLNTASLDELEVLPGFNDGFAREVIDYRTNFGGFQNIRELVDILGMGEADFVIARRYLTL